MNRFLTGLRPWAPSTEFVHLLTCDMKTAALSGKEEPAPSLLGLEAGAMKEENICPRGILTAGGQTTSSVVPVLVSFTLTHDYIQCAECS